MQSTQKAYKRVFGRSLKKSRKKLVRYGLITVNFAVLMTVALFVIGNRGSGESVSQSNAIINNSKAAATSPLDQLSSADIAVHVAKLTQLDIDETTSVTNTADSVKAQLTLSSVDNSYINKPQVIGSALPSNKDIKKYAAQAGEKISDIAAKFGVTSDSVRWSNALSGESVPAARQLVIPPVNGIVYTVKAGDTPESLAQRYQANKDQIIAINDAEVGGLKVGTQIVIQDGVQPVTRIPAASRASTSYSYGYAKPVYGANGYTFGYCTWHVANRRIQIGKPLPSNLGNATTWYAVARNMGMPTGTQPQAGAVLWDTNTRLAGGLGHVGFVEKVNEDGSILVSDMNYPKWGAVTYRTIPPSQFGSYRFIY